MATAELQNDVGGDEGREQTLNPSEGIAVIYIFVNHFSQNNNHLVKIWYEDSPNM